MIEQLIEQTEKIWRDFEHSEAPLTNFVLLQ